MRKPTPKRPKKTSEGEPPELAELRRAVDGLHYPSETDAPFEVLHWPAGGPAAGGATVRDHVAARTSKGQGVEESSFDGFFAGLAKAPDADRFAELRKTLESRLTDLTAFRVGEREVHVYLVGRTRAGDWVALRTLSVET